MNPITYGDLTNDLLESLGMPATVENGLSITQQVRMLHTPDVDTIDEFDELAPTDSVEYSKALETHSNVGVNTMLNAEVGICLHAGTDYMKMVPGAGGSLLAFKLLLVSSFRDVWIVTSPSHRRGVESLLAGIAMTGSSKIKVIEQDESYLFSPMNELIVKEKVPEVIPAGTGGAGPAMLNSGALQEFLDGGGKHVAFMKLDNVVARITSDILGDHVQSDRDVTVVTTKRTNDDSGRPVIVWHGGMKIALEEARLPYDYAFRCPPLMFTDTMIVKAENLLHSNEIPWKYEKSRVNVNGKAVITFLRHNHQWLQHLTDVSYIDVPREMSYMPLDNKDIENFVKSLRY